MKKISFILAILLCLAATTAFAAKRTFYFQATASVADGASERGTVYVSFADAAPADDAYKASMTTEVFSKEAGSTFSTPSNTTTTLYLYAKAAEGYRFMGWKTSGDDKIVSTEATYKPSVKSANYASAETPAVVTYYAVYQDESIQFNSKVNVTAVGGNGLVSVSTETGSTDFAAEMSGEFSTYFSTTDHKYYLKAKYEGANTIDAFEGWYSDKDCTEENLISADYTYTYTIPAEAVDSKTTTVRNIYAKFKDNYKSYQITNSDFSKWAANNEPGFGWNSFPSATGSMAGTGKGLSPNPSKVEGRGGEEDYAVRLISKFAGMLGIGANANGNLTTGIVNMGSMTPTDNSNHNFTDIDNEGHYMIIAGQPDAFELYAKFKMGDGDAHTAQAKMIIHDKEKYIDPEREEQAEHRIASAIVAIEESAEWTKWSADFSYENNWTKDLAAATVKYILVNITTNPTPGGSKSDELIIDDVRLIYNSEIKTATYNGADVTFTDGKASVDSEYDEAKLNVTSNGRAASIETEYDEKEATLKITVKGENIDEDATNFHEYTISFAKPEPTNVVLTTCEDSEATIYNLSGMRQNELQQGINIVGGKKIIK